MSNFMSDSASKKLTRKTFGNMERQLLLGYLASVFRILYHYRHIKINLSAFSICF